MLVALAGGVGGAKLAQGLMLAGAEGSSTESSRTDPAQVDPSVPELSVVVNTADDFELVGLRISPDLDTVLYTLAGIANPETGWGVAGDSFASLDMLGRYGADTWFRLGDRDFATHILRTQRLREGRTLTAITAELAAALGVGPRVLPMTDDSVATVVETPAGNLAFQDYFVRRHQTDEVRGVRFAGIESAGIPAGVVAAIRSADLIVLCPSNPIVSIGPILAVPGMVERLRAAAAPKVAVSPIVGGRALKGPADRMLASLGHEVSPLGVARLYRGLVQGMVIDMVDADRRGAIEELGMRVLVTTAVMGGPEDRRRLAAEVIDFGHTLT
jgi:LPPG:FO 2-phospho-L-lactate transferase